MRRVHHKVCVRDGLIVGWIDLTEYFLASTYDEFINSGKPHFLQEKRDTLFVHHRLATLLDTRGTDVLNSELDKPKITHSFRSVSLSCPGKDYLLAIRGTDADPHRRPCSNCLGNKDCIECYNLKPTSAISRRLQNV
ncbi:hypothetical protein AVEN_46071-1 [Araneus ventricosus]|uniref:Uncharacterized protein n=1 Tax=Araneus ventricosus TaxID=182803 RepID=A0A4Y2PF16_ARAVE|nr:hypothetical protein AVEN_46071-1 [Araneus ventricosus]